MRLKQYLTEKIDHDKINWDESGYAEDIVKAIKKDCKPWLKESNGIPSFRNSRKKQSYWIKRNSIRSGRRPLNTEEYLHKATDNSFKKYHGWNARTNVLFIQGSPTPNIFYGRVTYTVYPIGSFKYLWSPDIRDLTILMDSMKFDLENRVEPGQGPEAGKSFKDQLVKEADLLIKNSYTNKGLHNALKTYPINEIMVNCKEYYTIPDYIYYQYIKSIL
jgi:hypothetical protein